MSRRQRTSAKPSSRLWIKVTGIVGTLVIVAVALAFAFYKSWVMDYLRSAQFRKVLEERSGQDLRGRVEISPIRFEGNQFFSDGLAALGGPEAAFHSVKVNNVRGDFKLPPLLKLLFGDRKGIVDNVEVQQVEVDFDDLRTEMTVSPKEKHKHSQILNIAVRDTRLKWRSGQLEKFAVKITPRDSGWTLEGSGGRINQLGLPIVDVANLRAVYNEPSFFLQELLLQHDGGEINASGEIRAKDKADLQFVVKNVNVTPFLPDDWRARLNGRLNGDVSAVFSTKEGDSSPARLSGRLNLKDGSLEALPVLAKIAEFTKTDRFRKMRLDQLSADFQTVPQGITVQKFLLESKQLLVVKGAFSVINDQVDGTFEIGITPEPLQFLPGSQERVFTTNRDGYVWTTMRITGPTSAIREDLSSRLADAAAGAVVDKGIELGKGVLENGVKKSMDTAVDAAKKRVNGALDLLFGN